MSHVVDLRISGDVYCDYSFFLSEVQVFALLWVDDWHLNIGNSEPVAFGDFLKSFFLKIIE